MAIAGKKALVKASGAGVAFTDEATTKLVANTVYQITDATKRVWDRTAAITVKKDAIIQTTGFTINRLTGTVTFAVDQGGAAVITVSGTFLPMTTVAEAFEFNYTITRDNGDISEFGDLFINRLELLKDFEGSLTRWRSTSAYFHDAVINATIFVLEFFSDSIQPADLKAWVLIASKELSSSVDAVIEEAIDFEGTHDADRRVISLGTP